MRGRDVELPISDHGADRVRERLHLPRRATIRHLKKVLEKGLTPDQLKGQQRLRVEAARIRHSADEKNHEYRIYQGFFYVFDGETKALVTVIPLKAD